MTIAEATAATRSEETWSSVTELDQSHDPIEARGRPTRYAAAVAVQEREGVWVAFCRDVDAVSEGDSPPRAIQNLLEAIGVLLQLDGLEGRQPMPEEEVRALLESHVGSDPIHSFAFPLH